MELILLGIDGAEPSLVFKWAQEGFLPNFSRLIFNGATGLCKSTVHPITPQAWASIITGVGPGRHGIYDFGTREDKGYNFRLVTADDRTWPAFWELLSPDKKVGIVNVPLTYPPDPVNGFFIGGMHTPSLADGVYPKKLIKELEGYVIDVMCHWYKSTNDFLADVTEMAEIRHRNVLKLAKKHEVDILFPVYVAADRVQHALWGTLTKKHIERPGWAGDDGDAVFMSYKLMDDVLGDYLELADEHGARLLVVSDHGFGELKKDVYLNAVLAKHGLLAFDPDKIKKYTPRDVPLSQDPTHDWQRNAFPEGKVEFGDDKALAKGEVDPRYKSFDTVDWSKTKAYSAGLFGNVWINMKGREPEGIVKDGKQSEKLLNEIESILLNIKDPDDGRPIVDKVYRRGDLYEGVMAAKAPDLTVRMRDYAYITRGSTEFLCNTAVSDVVVNHTGNHRIQGIIGLTGPGIAKGVRLTGASVLDVTPTLLHLTSGKVPKGLEGRVLTDAYTRGFLASNPVRIAEPSKIRKPKKKGLSKKEQEIVKKRLMALGYLG